MKYPPLIQGIFGVLGGIGIGADPWNLTRVMEIADRLFGDSYSFSALGLGIFQVQFGVNSAMVGGHVRVGLGDDLFIVRAIRAESSAQQLTLRVDRLEDFGF